MNSLSRVDFKKYSLQEGGVHFFFHFQYLLQIFKVQILFNPINQDFEEKIIASILLNAKNYFCNHHYFHRQLNC